MFLEHGSKSLIYFSTLCRIVNPVSFNFNTYTLFASVQRVVSDLTEALCGWITTPILYCLHVMVASSVFETFTPKVSCFYNEPKN